MLSTPQTPLIAQHRRLMVLRHSLDGNLEKALIRVALLALSIGSGTVARCAEKPRYIYVRNFVTCGDGSPCGVVAKVEESGAITEEERGGAQRWFLYQDAVAKTYAGATVVAPEKRELSRSELLLTAASELRFYSRLLNGHPGINDSSAPYYSPSLGLMFWLPKGAWQPQPNHSCALAIGIRANHQGIEARWSIMSQNSPEVELFGPLAGSSQRGEVTIGGLLERRLRASDHALLGSRARYSLVVSKDLYLRELGLDPRIGKFRDMLSQSQVVITTDDTVVQLAGEGRTLDISTPVRQFLDGLKIRSGKGVRN